MQSLLDLHLDEVPDPITVEGGKEYELRITGASLEEAKSGSGRTVLKAVAEVVGVPEAKPIFINHAFPLKEDDNQKKYRMSLSIKQFCQAFDIDHANPGEPDEWVGQTGWVVLKAETNEQTGELQNSVARYLIKANS